MSVDKQSLLPLYHQVEESLRQNIADGVYLPDQPIPPEIELQKRFNVSRETVRKAVNNLVLAGLVEKRKGVGLLSPVRKLFQDLTNCIAPPRKFL